MPHNKKVFGIGYPKTAGSSLAKALNILGYKCLHDPYEVLPGFYAKELAGFPQTPNLLDDNDAFVGVVCLVYKALDQIYPGSKFILTVRDEDRWLKSIRGHLHPESVARKNDSRIPLQPFTREKLFRGHLWYEDEYTNEYLDSFRQHNQDVIDYFHGRDDLLIVNIEEGLQWDTLCNFLGCDIPDTPFPWKNKKKSSLERLSGLLKKLHHTGKS